MKTLHFQQITDDRFDDNILDLLNSRIEKIEELLDIEGVESVIVTNPRLIYFGDSKQYRSNFYVRKNRKITWNQIYGIVNSVKAVPYKFS